MKEKIEKNKERGKRTMEKLRKNKGITLIALVITIIVLLILAGVSIAMITGQNGILTQAQKAKNETENVANNEAVILDDYEYKINEALGIPQLPEVDDEGFFEKTSTINGEVPSANNPTIPAGYKPVSVGNASWSEIGTVPEVTSVNEGLVIQDKAGNQFVWIPVETPVSETEAEGTNNKAMAVKVGEHYRGLLYTFNSDNTSTVRDGCTTTNFENNSSYREPALVISDSSNGVTDLQREYDKMITSVSKYYGFYIGRYELGLDESSNPTSKKATNGITTADAGSTSLKNWYGLYNKCKEYASEEGTKSVVSSMTWGSQYDAMMNWMQANDVKVNKTGNMNTATTTGTSETDLLKNIYDLYGCHIEWTSEAYSIDRRIRRRWRSLRRWYASS